MRIFQNPKKNQLFHRKNHCFSRRLCSLHPRIQKTDSLKRIIKTNSLIPFFSHRHRCQLICGMTSLYNSMTSPYYRGEGGENTRHRVTGGAGSDRAGGGETIFFSAHRPNWAVKLVWVMRVGVPREQRNARDSQKDHRETSSPGGDTLRCRQNTVSYTHLTMPTNREV